MNPMNQMGQMGMNPMAMMMQMQQMMQVMQASQQQQPSSESKTKDDLWISKDNSGDKDTNISNPPTTDDIPSTPGKCSPYYMLHFYCYSLVNTYHRRS